MSDTGIDFDAQKREAGARAARLVASGMIVGLGTGSTANHATKAIASALKSGDLEDIRCVATSRRTESLALELGIPIISLEEVQQIDMTIDGADEVDPAGDLIKGGGGALLREKIVAVATKQYVIIVDETKMVDRLGVEFPLPVEVVKFGWRTLEAPIRELGAEPVMRHESAGTPFQTASGNYILDCHFEAGIADTAAMQQALISMVGVVETGLFVGMKPEVIVGRG